MPTSAQARRCPGRFDILPIEQLSTSYARLRPGRPTKPQPRLLAALPIRVVPVDGGRYEVVDGFKRLAACRDEGHQQIPVVVEAEGRPEDHKQLLLLGNAPPRTLTAADEAEVVASLRKEDGPSESRIARALSKTTHWVARRLDINEHLGPAAKQKLGRGALGPSAAHALCALSDDDQRVVVETAERHALTANESINLFGAYRVADEHDRKRLLADPKGMLEPDPSPAQSPLATAVERLLERIRNALLDLASFQIPSELGPPEQRRIEAVFRSVLALLHQTARAVLPVRAQHEEEDHVRRQRAKRPREPAQEEAKRERSRKDSKGDHRSLQEGLRHQEDRRQGRMVQEDRSPSPP